MKAVIVEIRDKFAAALSDDGCIVKIKNKDYAIGQVIEMKKTTVFTSKKWAALAACAAVVMVGGGVGAYAYTTPYSYVSLDVNPSIEYALNRFDDVLSVTAVNEDGSKILSQIETGNMTFKDIDEAISLTIDEISKEGYLGGDTEGGIVIAASAEDLQKAEELTENLQQTVEKEVQENGDEVAVEVITVAQERVAEAKALGITPGKLNLIQKLQASAADSSSIKIEDWINKPVKDIMKATKLNKQAEKVQPDDEISKDGEQTEEQAEEQDKAVTSSGEAAKISTDDNKKTQAEEKVKVQKKTDSNIQPKTENKVQSKVETQTQKKLQTKTTDKIEVKEAEKTQPKAVENPQAKTEEKEEQKEEQKAEVKENKKEEDNSASEKAKNEKENSSESSSGSSNGSSSSNKGSNGKK